MQKGKNFPDPPYKRIPPGHFLGELRGCAVNNRGCKLAKQVVYDGRVLPAQISTLVEQFLSGFCSCGTSMSDWATPFFEKM
jgi:hypothetical protein